jgi:hypothetical protein
MKKTIHKFGWRRTVVGISSYIGMTAAVMGDHPAEEPEIERQRTEGSA